jgi:hypothetical protein
VVIQNKLESFKNAPFEAGGAGLAFALSTFTLSH